MKDVALQYAKLLSTFPGATYEENKNKYKLVATHGVKWGDGSKWGNVHFDRKNMLYIAMDFPKHSRSVEQLRNILNLKQVSGRPSSRDFDTGFYILQFDDFDSIRIRIMEHDIKSTVSANDNILLCAEEIYRLASR